MNHRLLSEFRTDHGAALDELFTQVIASLVEQELVSVSGVSQDGVRVRVSAGAGSFRREERLRKLLAGTQEHVRELRRQVEAPAEFAGQTARVAAARQRAVEERERRLEQALAQLPEMKQQREAAGGCWQVRAKDSGEATAGEHERRGSAGDEDGERRIQSGGECAVGDGYAEPRDCGSGSEQRGLRRGELK